MTSSMMSFATLVVACIGVLLLQRTFQALHTGSAEQARQHYVQNKHYSNCVASYLSDMSHGSSKNRRGVSSCEASVRCTRLRLQYATPQTSPERRGPLRSSVLQVPDNTAWSPWVAAAAGVGLVPASKLAIITLGFLAALVLRPGAQQPKSSSTNTVTWRAHLSPPVWICLLQSLSTFSSRPTVRPAKYLTLLTETLLQ